MVGEYLSVCQAFYSEGGRGNVVENSLTDRPASNSKDYRLLTLFLSAAVESTRSRATALRDHLPEDFHELSCNLAIAIAAGCPADVPSAAADIAQDAADFLREVNAAPADIVDLYGHALDLALSFTPHSAEHVADTALQMVEAIIDRYTPDQWPGVSQPSAGRITPAPLSLVQQIASAW